MERQPRESDAQEEAAARALDSHFSLLEGCVKSVAVVDAFDSVVVDERLPSSESVVVEAADVVRATAVGRMGAASDAPAASAAAAAAALGCVDDRVEAASRPPPP